MKTVFCVIVSAAIAAIPTYGLAHEAGLTSPTFALYVVHTGLTMFIVMAFEVFSE